MPRIKQGTLLPSREEDQKITQATYEDDNLIGDNDVRLHASGSRYFTTVATSKKGPAEKTNPKTDHTANTPGHC